MVMKLFTQLAGALVIAGWATAGMAFFDGEVFYGSSTRQAKVNVGGVDTTKEFKGTEMGATFLLDPIPLVPFAFGVTASQGTADIKDVTQVQADDLVSSGDYAGYTATGTGTSKTMFYGPVVKVWIPMPKIQPYLKAGYLMGTEVVDETFDMASPSGTSPAVDISIKAKTTYTHTATEMTAGLGFSPVKLTSIFAEYSILSGKRKAKTLSGDINMDVGGATGNGVYTSADLTDDDKKEKSAGAKTIRFGVSVGI
jgi:hypothetical protein